MRPRPKLTERQFDRWASDLKGWIAESVSPFDGDTAARQRDRKLRAEADLLYFCQTYLPHYFPAEFGDFHREWEALSERRDEVVLLAAPREHAKSTFFSFAVLLRNIVQKRRNFQVIISDTNDQATGFALPVRLELEENQRLRHDYGDLRGETWADGDFDTSNGVRTLARGRGQKVRGLKHRQYRPDYVCVDDFENDENVENPRLVKKGLKWLRQAVLGALAQGFTFVMVGNLFHARSVLSRLIAEKDESGQPLYTSRLYKAWLDYGTADQRPLWPGAWSAERLERLRRLMGTAAFMSEMMHQDNADGRIKPEWLRFSFAGDVKEMRIATFVDPSATSSDKSDFKAVVTVGLIRETMEFHVLHAWIRRASFGEMFNAAYHQHELYGGQIGIEENMFKDLLHDAIAAESQRRGKYLPWIAIHHHANKLARISGTLAILAEHSKLFFRPGQSDQDALVEQLIYLENHTVPDDGPDALEGAVSLLQKHGGHEFTFVAAREEPARRSLGDEIEDYRSGGLISPAAEFWGDYLT
jgi:predicted phage terminase large subunit-like protein